MCGGVWEYWCCECDNEVSENLKEWYDEEEGMRGVNSWWVWSFQFFGFVISICLLCCQIAYFSSALPSLLYFPLLSFHLLRMNESQVLFERYRTVFHNIAVNNGSYCLNDSSVVIVCYFVLTYHILVWSTFNGWWSWFRFRFWRCIGSIAADFRIQFATHYIGFKKACLYCLCVWFLGRRY